MTAIKHLTFPGVEGYKTAANAAKRGNEIAAKYDDLDFRWVVITLANGRFAPMMIANSRTLDIGILVHEKNLCLAN